MKTTLLKIEGCRPQGHLLNFEVKFPFQENFKLRSFVIENRPKIFTIVKCNKAEHPNANEKVELKKTFKKTFQFNDREIYEIEVDDFSQIEKTLKEKFESEYDCLVILLFLNGSRDVSRNQLTKYLSADNTRTRKLRLIFVLGSSDENVVYEEVLNEESNAKVDFVLFYSENIVKAIDVLCTKTFKSISYSLMTKLKIAIKELNDDRKIDDASFLISTLTESQFCSEFNTESYPKEKYPISAKKSGIFHKTGKCVIFNFEKFNTQDLPNRSGTHQDVRSLVATFGELNFDFSVYHDLKSDEVVPSLKDELNGISEKYECFVICLLSNGYYGKVFCSDGVLIELGELVGLVAQNEALCGKPKLFFVQTSQELLPDTVSFKNYPDLFIFYSAYIGQKAYRNTTEGTWFIQSLSRAIQQYSAEHDLEEIAATVSDSVAECLCNYQKSSSKFNKSFSEIKGYFQNPCLYSTLTKPLIFKLDQDELRFQPESGRCLILCFEGKSYFNTFDLTASFVNRNYYCKTIRNLTHNDTVDILQKESENDIANCNSFVLFIYANDCDEQEFETSQGFRTIYFNFKNLFEKTKKRKTKIPFNIFVNPISRKDNSCYCQQEGNLFVFYNSFALDWRKDSEKHNEMIEKCLKTLSLVPDEKYLKFLEFQFSCISNPNENGTKEEADANLTENVYAGVEKKAGRCVIVSCAQNQFINQVIKLQSTFEALKFDVELQIAFNRSDIDEILDKESQNANGYNCFVVFVLAICANNEIILENNEKLGIKKLFDYFDAKKCPALNGKPKLFFIQDLMKKSENVESILDIKKDYLLTIVRDNFNFLKSFCELAKHHCIEYDLLSLIHLARLMTMTQSKSEQPSFTFKSRLTKQFFLNKPPWLVNQDYIKSDRLFYRDGLRKCVIFNNIPEYDYQATALEKTFENLNYSVTKFAGDEIEHFKYGMLKDDTTCEYLFMFLFVDQETDAVIVEKLIKHLSGVQNLWGKPKVIFLLGSYKLVGDFSLATKSDYKEISINDYRIATYADILLFSSKYVSHTVESLCTFLRDSNTREKYDLMTILSMISHKKITQRNLQIQPITVSWFISNFLNIPLDYIRSIFTSFYSIFYAPNRKFTVPRVVSNINSTLTRLISMKSPINEKFTLNQNITNVLPETNRGICMIFNHSKFESIKKESENGDNLPRIGTEKDVQSLQTTFKNLKFKVEIKDNLTLKEVIKEIKNIDATNVHCFIACFLTHGREKKIRCLDKYIAIDQLIKLIAHNPTLTGKPKFLIFQACRGSDYDYGNETKIVADGIKMVNSPESPQSTYSDIFVFWSTFEGYISMRNEENGSLFIQTFCQELTKNCNQYDFATIASIVSRIVSQQTPSCTYRNKSEGSLSEKRLTKQIPTFYSTQKQPVSFSLNQ